MTDPISIGLALLVAFAKDALQSNALETAVSGIIGNRADYLFTKGLRNIKDIIDLRNGKFPENHDLLRALRKSMLRATEMLNSSMKENHEEKQFRKILKSWIDEQIKLLPTLSNWADWNNPASNELEFFFVNEKQYSENKKILVQKMTLSWEEYIESQLKTSLPPIFKNSLKDGWLENDKLITWHEATMVIMVESLRNPKDDQSIRAAKAFEHNFLSNIKLQLSDIHELLLSQFSNKETIIKHVDTIASQQRTIEIQVEENKLNAETINLILKRQFELENKLKQSETEKAQLQVENKINKEIIDRAENDRKELNDFYKLYPASYQSKLEAIVETKNLEQLSKEADIQRELRKTMEFEETMRNSLLKMKLSKQYEASYNFSEAIKSCKVAIDLWDYPPFTIEMARLLFTIGKYSEANKTLQRVLISEELAPHELEYSLNGWNLSGNIFMELMSYENAAISFVNALLIHEKLFGKVVDKGGEMLFNNIGCVYLKLGEFEKSRFYLDKALEATNIIYGEDSIKSANCLNNIGDALKLQGDFSEAKKYFDQAYGIFKSKGIKTHIELPPLYDNLSLINLQLQEINEALKFAKESLKVRTEIFGKKAFHTAKSYLIIGKVYKKMGKSQKALENFKEAAIIFEGEPINGRVLLTTERKHGIIDSYLSIAYHLMDCEDWVEAYNWFQIPLNIFTIDFGNDSFQVARIFADRGVCKFKSNSNDKMNINEAKELWQQAMIIFQKDNQSKREVAEMKDNIDYANEILEQ